MSVLLAFDWLERLEQVLWEPVEQCDLALDLRLVLVDVLTSHPLQIRDLILQADNLLSDFERLVQATALHAQNDLVDESPGLAVQLLPLTVGLRNFSESHHRFVEVLSHIKVNGELAELLLQGN